VYFVTKEPSDSPDIFLLDSELQLLRKKIEELETLRGVPQSSSWPRRMAAAIFLSAISAVLLLAIMGAQSKPDALFIDAKGNVGINQTSPQAPLDVNGNAVVRGKLDVAGNDGAVQFPDGTTQTTAALPAGAVIPFNSDACPAGWSEYTPAYGRFIRGIDKGGNRDNGDPDGQRRAGAVQGDAIRNITGSISGVNGASNKAWPWGFLPGNNGAFSVPKATYGQYNVYNGDYYPPNGSGQTASFDASRVVPTAPEDRPKNVALLYCEKKKN
jgi:hypothetical protein